MCVAVVAAVVGRLKSNKKSEIRGFVCDADAEKALSFVENRKYNLADAACGN